MSERIFLRAIAVTLPATDDAPGGTRPGVMLPDDRIIVLQGAAVRTFDGLAALTSECPGAALHFFPDAEAALNYTMTTPEA